MSSYKHGILSTSQWAQPGARGQSYGEEKRGPKNYSQKAGGDP